MKSSLKIIVCGFTLILALHSYGQTQLGSDIDGEAAGDLSGQSVSMSADGSRLAIGATGNDDGGDVSGHVRAYEFISGSWTQIGQDIDGEAENDQSGTSVSFSGDGSRLAIGATLNDGNGTSSGHVRIYELSSGVWNQLGQDIDGEAVGDLSGHAVSMSADGSRVAIGAPANGGNGAGSGHVRVFEYASGSWSQLGLDIDGEAAGDQFGSSVSMSSDGTILAAGALANGGNGTGSGHVRVFEYASGSWSQLGLDIDGEEEEEYSGRSVSLSADGSRVAIGADSNDENGNQAGQVRVYELISGNWSQVGDDINGETAAGLFGFSVALSSAGDRVVAGAISGAGYSRAFEYSDGNWVQLGNDIHGEASMDHSGIAVSISPDGSQIAIGAYTNDGNGSNSGHVRVFSLPEGLPTLEYSNSIDLTNSTRVTFDGAHGIGDQENEPQNLVFKPDGTKLFILGTNGDDVSQYTLSTPFDITTGVSFDGSSISHAFQESFATGLAFSRDGKKMFITGDDREVYIYCLEIPYDITTGVTYDNNSFDLSNEVPAGISDLTFNTAGTKMFIVLSNSNIYQYNLSNPFDLSAGVTFEDVLDLSMQDPGSVAIAFNKSGTKLFLLEGGLSIKEINQFSLTNPFDLVSDILTDGDPFDISSQETGPTSIAFDASGSRMFIIGTFGDDINQYSIEGGFFESPDDDGSVTGSLDILIHNETFTNAGGTLSSPADYSIDNLPTGLSPSLSVSDDGSFATLTLTGAATSHDYEDDLENLIFSFQNSAFTGNDVEIVSNAIGASSHFGISFEEDDPPVFTSPNTAAFTENQSGTVIDINANDGDGGFSDAGITYSISNGMDQDIFDIDGNLGLISFKEIPDFENPSDNDSDNIYEVTVTASDGVFTADQMIEITVNDVEEQPEFLSPDEIFFNENGSGTVVDVNANDGDGGDTDSGIIFSLSGGEDEQAFNMDLFGVLTFKNSPDFENPTDFDADGEYNVEVTANDGFSSSTQSIIVTITNVDESPVFESENTLSIDENTIGTVLNVDANDGDGGSVDAGIAYSITGGDDEEVFNIDASSGGLSFKSSPDFETPTDSNGDNVFTVLITAYDGTNSTEQIIVITMNNINENPVFLSANQVTYDENSTESVIDVNANNGDAGNPDVDIMYSISGGPDQGNFEIDASGVLTFINPPDYENPLDDNGDNVYEVLVTAEDGSHESDQLILVTVTDVFDNQAPVMEDQTFDVDENTSGTTLIGQMIASDPDNDMLTFSSTIDVNDPFDLSAEGFLTVDNSSLLDHEAVAVWAFSVEVSDGNGETTTAALIINVNDVNEAPIISDFTFNIEENSPNGTVVGNLSASDPEGDMLTFSSTMNSADPFTLSPDGEVTVTDEALLDYESVANWSFSVEVSDENGETATAALFINVNDIDENILSIDKEPSIIHVYPNPIGDHLIINLSDLPSKTIEISILDLRGGIHHQEKLSPGEKNKYILNLNHLSPGAYIAQLILDEKNVINIKVMKNR